METLIRDIRFSFWSLLKRPGFTAVAVVTLALGIIANTAIFRVVDANLPQPLLSLACYIPAKRATRVDPLIALKQE